MKRLFLLLIFLASAVCADDYFPVGFWQPPEKVDEAFFKTLADGNFTLVFSNLGNQFKNLDMAKAAGMKVYAVTFTMPRERLAEAELDLIFDSYL